MEGLKITFTKNPYNISIYSNEKIVKEFYFENAIDFITTLHYLTDTSDSKIIKELEERK